MAAYTRSSASPADGGHTTIPRNGWEASLLAADEFRIRLFGEWVLARGAHSPAELSRRLSEVPRATKITFDTQDLTTWDNILIEFLNKLETIAGERGISIDRSGLPGGPRGWSPWRRPSLNAKERGAQRPSPIFSPASAPAVRLFLRRPPILSVFLEKLVRRSAG